METLGGAFLTGYFMFRYFTAALVGILIPVTSVSAGERSRIGYGRVITNDFMGDHNDRWRTGSVASSRVWGPEWTGELPEKFGELIELRLGAEIIAPESLTAFDANDRRYGTSLSIGAHTHYLEGKTEVSAGADLVLVGPETGLSSFQDALHDLLDVPPPSNGVLRNQIEGSIYPTMVIELGRSYEVGESTRLRPFVEARAGVESLLRVGVDLTFGSLGRGELMMRDPVTGQRYRTIAQEWTGFSTVFGADLTAVGDSAFFPEDRGPAAKKVRERVRLGVHWQGKDNKAVFYGATWLGEEFEGQSGGQVVGSARFNFRF